MIEIICKDDGEKTIQNNEEEVFLPKNIRQVGSPRGRHRIYLEDYVYTYLRSEAKNHEKCAAVFLGKSQVVKDIRYTFISGVVECGAAIFQWEDICLDESFWDYIYKEQKQFFSEMEIVGWALGKAGQAMELTQAVEAAHRKYFAGRDKILMLLDVLEGEELFFVYEQGYLQKREGYYIYYEKNLAMQSYMIYKREEEMRLEQLGYSEFAEDDIKENIVEESVREEPETFSGTGDEQARESVIQTQERKEARTMLKEPKTQAEEALESYRRMLLERQGRREERRNRRFLYTASSFFLVVLCVIGITTINNYRKMQEVEDVLNIMRRSVGQSLTDEKTDLAKSDPASEEDPLVVETVESQIDPLEEGMDSKDADAQETQSINNGTGDAAVGEEQETDMSGNDETKTVSDNEKQGNAGEDDAMKGDSDSDDVQQDDSGRDVAGTGQKEGQQDSQASEGTTQETSAIEQDGDKRYYTVQAGDTLNMICLKIYHTKDMVQTLKEINGIEDGDKILVGQRLLLP